MVATRRSYRSARGGTSTCGPTDITSVRRNCASFWSGAPRTANRSFLGRSHGPKSISRRPCPSFQSFPRDIRDDAIRPQITRTVQYCMAQDWRGPLLGLSVAIPGLSPEKFRWPQAIHTVYSNTAPCPLGYCTPAKIPMHIDDFDRCSLLATQPDLPPVPIKFRELIIERVNAGKTSILQRMRRRRIVRTPNTHESRRGSSLLQAFSPTRRTKTQCSSRTKASVFSYRASRPRYARACHPEAAAADGPRYRSPSLF
jgi:hypothetical protein